MAHGVRDIDPRPLDGDRLPAGVDGGPMRGRIDATSHSRDHYESGTDAGRREVRGDPQTVRSRFPGPDDGHMPMRGPHQCRGVAEDP